MLEIVALHNGAHRNQTFHGNLPDGWAVIPEDMELENFPFGVVTAEEVVHYRDVAGAVEQEPYGVMTVTAWEALPMPEPEPMPESEPTTEEILNAMLGVN